MQVLQPSKMVPYQILGGKIAIKRPNRFTNNGYMAKTAKRQKAARD